MPINAARILLLLALVAAASGQSKDALLGDEAKTDPRRTNGFTNCLFWRASGDELRFGIMIGYLDNWNLVERNAHEEVPIPVVSYRELIRGVTALCSKLENGRLTIYDVLKLFSFEVFGRYDVATLEKITADMRKARSSLHLP